MITISKKDVVQCGIGGVSIHGYYLVRCKLRSNGTVFELRHTWSESVDARVWDAIRRSVFKYIQERSNLIGKTVYVCSKGGNLVWCASPEVSPNE